MELPAVKFAVHVGIREKDFCGAAFDNHVEDVRAPQVVERLRREHHRGVVLPPGLQRFHNVPLDARVLQEHPCFIDEEGFEDLGDLPVGDDGVGPVEDIEEQRFKEFRVLAHPLKVKTLEL